MAELRLQINTQQAKASSEGFKTILTDIKNAARAIDDMSFDKLGGTINSLVTASEKILTSFNALRGVIQGIRTDLTGLATEVRNVARAAEVTPRARRTRTSSPVVDDAEVVATNSALVAFTSATRMSTQFVASIVEGAQAFVPFVAGAKGGVEALQSFIGTFAQFNGATDAGVAALERFLSTFTVVNGAGTTGIAMLEGIASAFAAMNGFAAQAAPLLLGMSTAMVAFSGATLQATASVREFSAIGERAFATYMRLKTLALPGRDPNQGRIGAGPTAGASGSSSDYFGGTAVATRGSVALDAGAWTFFSKASRDVPFEAVGKGFIDVKAKKDALDKNLNETANTTIPGFNRSFLFLAGILAAFTVRAIIRDLESLGKALFETGRDFERTMALFRSGAHNDIDLAGRNFIFASDSAKKYGLELKQTAEDQARLRASAMNSTLEGEKLDNVLQGLAAAQSVLGQSTEKGTGLFKVFTDILGKGRLQSEELVKQLGNIVPGSLRLVAESLNMTTGQLTQAVARGTLDVEKVLIAVANEFTKRFGVEALQNVNRLAGSFNNLKTAIQELSLSSLFQGGVAAGLVGGFKTITDFLNERETRVAIAQLSEFITNALGAALTGLITILRFVRDNLETVILLIGLLTSAATIGGIILLARGFYLLGQTISAIATTSGLRLLVLLGSIGASFYLGKLASNAFAEGLGGVLQKLDAFEANKDRLRNLPLEENTKVPDATRAQVEAQERLDKEMRTFNQDLENQIELFDLSVGGVSTLSVAYEAHAKVLERIKALVRGDIFNRLTPTGQEEEKRRIAESFFGPEVRALALQEAGKLQQTVERAIRDIRQRATDTQVLVALANNGANQSIIAIERQFQDQFRQMQEKYATIIANVPADRVDKIVEAFKKQAVALREAVVQAGLYENRLKAIQDINQGEQDLALEEEILKIWQSVNDNVTKYTQQATRETAGKGIASFTPTTINPASESVNAFLTNVEKAGIGAARQNINGPVTMTITGSVTITNPQGVALSGAPDLQTGRMLQTPTLPPIGGEAPLQMNFRSTTSSGTNLGVEFTTKVNAIASNLGVNPEFLMQVMNFETAGTFSPSVKNKAGSGATGLIQFMPATAQGLGTSTSELAQMNQTQQLDYVEKYFKPFTGKLNSLMDTYMAVLYPKAIGRGGDYHLFTEGTKAYEQNRGLDIGGKGYVTAADATEMVLSASRRSSMSAQMNQPLQPANVGTGTEISQAAIVPFGGAVGALKYGRAAAVAAVAYLPYLLGGSTNTADAPTQPVQGKSVDDLMPKIPHTVEEFTKGAEIFQQQEAARAIIESRKRVSDSEKQAAKEISDAYKVVGNAALDAQEVVLEASRMQMTADMQALQSTLKVGEVRAATGERTRLQAEKDIAVARALADFNKNVQLTGQDPYSATVEAQRRQVEFRAARGVDIAKVQENTQYNMSLATQNKELQNSIKFLGEDARYRDIDAKAANDQRIAVESYPFGKELQETQKRIEANRILAKTQQDLAQLAQDRQKFKVESREINIDTQSLNIPARYRQIEAEFLKKKAEIDDITVTDANRDQIQADLDQAATIRDKKKAYQDLNGPLQQYHDTLLSLKDIDIGIQQVAVDSVKELANNYLNLKNVLAMLATEQEKRNKSAQTDASVKQIKDYTAARQQLLNQSGNTNTSLTKGLEDLEKRNTAAIESNNKLKDSFSAFDKVGFVLGNFFDTVLDRLQKMIIEVLIVEPLVKQLKETLSSTAASGGSGGGIWGTIANLAVKLLGAIGGGGNNGSVAELGSTGGMVTLQGIQHFQGGGMVGMGTDTVPAWLTPGEVVLNRGQQAQIAGAMQGQQNNTFNIVLPGVQNEDQGRRTGAQVYSEISARLERQRLRDGVRARR